MDVIVNEGRRYRRTKGTKKPGSRGHGTDRTAFGYLVNVAIKLSESKHGTCRLGLPIAVGVDELQKSQAPGYGISTGRREAHQSRSRGPANAFEDHLLQLHLTEQRALEGYANRIEHLRLILDEEDRTIHRDSEHDFWDFVHRHPFAQSGQIVITDEGHIRLVWKGDDEAHIGIRFLGNRRVRYVIFVHRPGERELSESSGEDSFDGLVKQARAYGLQALRA